MFKMKKAIASLSVAAILSTFVVSTAALAGTFGDVLVDDYFYNAVETGVTQGWVDDSNENFRPRDLMNRAEAAKTLVEAAGLTCSVPTNGSFTDVGSSEWFFEPVECAVQNGVASGYSGEREGQFGPGDLVTREQFAKMVVGAFDLDMMTPNSNTFPDVLPAMWSYEYVETAYMWSVINGFADNTFGPEKNIIRADAVLMAVRAQNPVLRPDDPGSVGCESGEIVVDGECVPAPEGGDLNVSLSSSTPGVQTSIPAGATGVHVASFDFEAGDKDVVLKNLTVRRVGVGSTDDFAKVYLYNGTAKLGNGKTLNDSTNAATFNNVGVMIDAFGTETIDVKVDIDKPLSDNGVHAFQITDGDKVDSTADTVTGSFPVRANDFGTSTVEGGSVDVESNGTDYTRRVGETDVEVANFTVHVDSEEDAIFRGLTLYNDDDDVVTDLILYRGSDQVATGVQNGRYFTFMLDNPIQITKGDAISFDVRGNIGGKDGDTAEFYVRYSTDVMVEGVTYGYNLFVDAAEGDSADSYVDEVDSTPLDNVTTVEAGQLTVSFNGPPSDDVPVNTNNVVLMDFTVSTQSDIDVEKMTVNISGNGGLAASDLDDISVFCGDVLVANEGTVTIGDNVFNDTWNLFAGESVECRVEVDVTNTAANGDTVEATLKDLTSSANWTFRDAETNDTITDIVPSGDIAGNTMTITEPSLDIDLAASPGSNNTYVKGEDGARIVGFLFTAGDSEDITVNTVKLTAYADDNQNAFADAADKNQTSGAEDVLGSVAIYERETMTLLDTPDSLDVGTTDISVQFDTLDWLIPKGESRTLLVMADITTTAPLSANDDDVAIAIAAAGDVDAEYGTGTSVTPTLTNGNTTPTRTQEVTDVGTLNMTLDASTPDAELLTLGDPNAVVATVLKFKSTNEAFNVEDITVSNANGDSNNVDSVQLTYVDENGVTQTKSKPLNSSDEAVFTGLNPPIYVPDKDEGSDIALVSVSVKTQDVDSGGVNGEDIQLDVPDGSGAEVFRAVGVGSGEVLDVTSNGVDLTGETHTVYESFPTFEFLNVVPGGAPVVPSASQKLAELQITAGANEDVTFDTGDGNQLVLEVSSSCGTATADELFTLEEDGTLLASPAAVDICAATEVQFDFEDSVLTVAAGTSTVVDVRGDTSEMTATGDNIQLWLSDDADANLSFAVDGTGDFEEAVILFRGDIFATSFVRD